MKISIGFAIAFLLGIGCQVLRIPLPAPHNLLGALLVLAITLGYLFGEYFF